MWRPSSTIPLLITVLVLAPSSALRADEVYDAQYALDQARAARDAAVAELDRTNQSIQQLEQSQADAPRKLEEASAALVRLGAELPDRRAARDDAQQRLHERAEVAKQIHDEAWSRFSSRTPSE